MVSMSWPLYGNHCPSVGERLDNSCKVLKYATKLAGTLGTPEYSKYSRPSKKEVEILRNTQVYFSGKNTIHAPNGD